MTTILSSHRPVEVKEPLMSTPNSRATYAPPESNPLRLASATVKAVDQLGAVTAEEIEHAAEQVLEGAQEVAEHLRKLAEAVRHNTVVAAEYVGEFCGKANAVLEAVRKSSEQLNAKAKEEKPQEDHEKVSVPHFLQQHTNGNGLSHD